jgi:riboflavin biosynthesis pyrimidine reductase
MSTAYPKIDYDYKAIALKRLFRHEDEVHFQEKGLLSPSALKVYGDLRFPTSREDRVYTMGCFVTSIDGKLAFPDNPAGPVVAKANSLDAAGAEADFWVLNLFRANADIIIGGAGTMWKEPDGTCSIFDRDLEDARVKAGKPAAPWLVVCSLDGTDIRYQDTLFDSQPVMLHTSPAGEIPVREHYGRPFYIVGPYADAGEAAADSDAIRRGFEARKDAEAPVILTGEGSETDSAALLTILRIMGMERALVESPSYCHVLMQDALLDELTLNYSCLYIGGIAVGLGNGMEPFTSTRHPESELLSIHMHSPSFLYFRHRLRYGW